MIPKVLTFLLQCLGLILKWCRWGYVNLIRIGLGTAQVAKLDDISLAYQSENYIVVNKRQDVKINSNDEADRVTVETQLRHLYPELVDNQIEHGFRFVHRLDYATSGLMCLALNKKGARWAYKAFRKRETTKHYLALVRGHVLIPCNNIIEIEKAIGQDSDYQDCFRMCVPDKPSCREPRPAYTRLMVLEWGTYDNEPATKVLLIPHTGRTHQLRVHCGSIGHLIVGDYTYSCRKDIYPYRMMLHAFRLILPMKHEHIDITSSDPFVPEIDPKWQPREILADYDLCLKWLEKATDSDFDD